MGYSATTSCEAKEHLTSYQRFLLFRASSCGLHQGRTDGRTVGGWWVAWTDQQNSCCFCQSHCFKQKLYCLLPNTAMATTRQYCSDGKEEGSSSSSRRRQQQQPCKLVGSVLKKGKQPSNILLTALLTRAFGPAGPAQQCPSKCTGRDGAGLSLLLLSLNTCGGERPYYIKGAEQQEGERGWHGHFEKGDRRVPAEDFKKRRAWIGCPVPATVD